MSFAQQITLLLYAIADWFLTGYYRVSGWIIPFNYLASPLYYIYLGFRQVAYYFTEFNSWLSWANSRLSTIVDIPTIVSFFQSWIDKAEVAYHWIVNAISNTLLVVEAWWSNKQQLILTWIEQAKAFTLTKITELALALSSLLSWWNDFANKIPTLTEIFNWFSNWWANIFANLSSWWLERLIDIKSLLNSFALELSPFWEGWQEVREEVFSFLSNPIEYLWLKFTDWFLGKEQNGNTGTKI